MACHQHIELKKNPTHTRLIYQVYLRIFREFSHEPFSWNHAQSVKTDKFIVDYKASRFFDQKILGLKG